MVGEGDGVGGDGVGGIKSEAIDDLAGVVGAIGGLGGMMKSRG